MKHHELNQVGQGVTPWTVKQEVLGSIPTALSENSPVSGSSLKKAEIFYGYFEIYSYPK